MRVITLRPGEAPKFNEIQRNFRHHQRRDIARRHADIVHDPGNGHAPARAGRVLQALRP